MKSIEGKRWYRPKEIADLALITNSRGKGDYNFVLQLIRSGRLRARDYATGPKGMHYWLVPEDEIARYNSSVTKIGEILTKKGA